MKKNEVDAIRAFNREYILILGILNNNMKDLDFSLTEGRVLFEIDAGENIIANQLAVKLQLDRSYLNRLINRLSHLNLIEKKNSESDHRIKILNLTCKGHSVLKEINLQNEKMTEEIFSKFSQNELHDIIQTMHLITNRLL